MNTAILLAAQAAGQSGGAMPMIIMMVAVFAIMWLFMIRPQQKEAKNKFVLSKMRLKKVTLLLRAVVSLAR